MSITPASRIATGALRAAGTATANSAHNTANINTKGFKPGRTTYSDMDPGVQARAQAGRVDEAQADRHSETSLVRETTERIGAAIMYRANLSVIRDEDERLGTLLDITG